MLRKRSNDADPQCTATKKILHLKDEKKQKNGICLIDSGLDSQWIFWKRIMINKLILAGLLLRILNVQTRVVGNENDAGLFERKASPEYDGYLEEDSPAVDATTLRLVQAVIMPFFIGVYIEMSTQCIVACGHYSLQEGRV